MQSLTDDNLLVVLLSKTGFLESEIERLTLNFNDYSFSLVWGGSMVVHGDYNGYFACTSDTLTLTITGENRYGKYINYRNPRNYTIKYTIYNQKCSHDTGYYKELTFNTVRFSRSPFGFKSGNPVDKIYYSTTDSVDIYDKIIQQEPTEYNPDVKLDKVPPHFRQYYSASIPYTQYKKFKLIYELGFKSLYYSKVLGMGEGYILLVRSSVYVLLTPDRISTFMFDGYTFKWDDITNISTLSERKENKKIEDILKLRDSLFP
jgi:hypothetical protein